MQIIFCCKNQFIYQIVKIPSSLLIIREFGSLAIDNENEAGIIYFFERHQYMIDIYSIYIPMMFQLTLSTWLW